MRRCQSLRLSLNAMDGVWLYWCWRSRSGRHRSIGRFAACSTDDHGPTLCGVPRIHGELLKSSASRLTKPGDRGQLRDSPGSPFSSTWRCLVRNQAPASREGNGIDWLLYLSRSRIKRWSRQVFFGLQQRNRLAHLAVAPDRYSMLGLIVLDDSVVPKPSVREDSPICAPARRH